MSTTTMLESLPYCQSFKGYDLTKQKSHGYFRAISRTYRSSIFTLHSVNKQVSQLSHSGSRRIIHRTHVPENLFKSTTLIVPSFSYWKGFSFSKDKPLRWERLITNVAYDVAGAVEVINDLGSDTLTFLAVTVIIVPTFKLLKASPILGFFFAGVVLNQFGLIRNLEDVKVLSEWGILFLLFEMGLELSLARLKALAKYAFVLGLAQVVLSTLAFTAFELPPNGAIGTKVLEFLFHSRSDLVNIRSVDEAVVIGAALSLSSSAFVLQLLAEKGELPTRFGSATLGILLLQDLAVIPLLIILPILESQTMSEESIWPMLLQESLKALGGLGLLSFGTKYILRRVFEVVAETRSSEAFVALCLLTVAGTSLITQHLGFSDTLGAFLAGAILAETNFRTQIEADIRPFRGLLLGLFFLTTGTSIDMQVLLREWPNVLALLAGLIAIKTLIITAIGPRVGLTLQESVRIGLLLSQGGEFGFVVFSLANRLGVLPLELNKLLIIVVVLSMALTPFLNEAGRRASSLIDDKSDAENKASEAVNFDASEPVVILGFGQMGQVLANFLGNPLASRGDSGAMGWPYVAFDLDHKVVKAARKIGFPILYGDGSRPDVLQSAGINSPKAIMVMYTGKKKTIEAVQRLRLTFPAIPIYARAQDLKHLLDLKKSGATDAILANAETSLQLGSKLMKGLGVMSDDVTFLSQLIRDSMELQAQEAVNQSEYRELDIMKPLQVKVSNMIEARVPVATASPEYELSELNQKDLASLSRIPKEVDAEEQDYELNQAVNSEGNGVICSKQGTKENSTVESKDALEP
ncbi:PREDICTED: K(+) efflux antiporter 3, chloroplastic isoform X2 [Lupinus angustifolius]|uniref:K(+) efflux antiporter 3, chloroplastic isoform X2 n=1 Tax=Lupinus angustifolius TaxID=3871 RepID=UPI00092F626A|nr:PREDICTED: K(+) efflux antiporter 3, chloroplastic isoform X2 [Lupinus angustifolius]